MMSSRTLLGCLIAMGLVLRLVGLRFGLPELYHADEPIVVNHAMAYGTGDLNPHFFQIPPLISYLLFVIYGVYFLAGCIIGKFPNAGAFADLFLSDPTSFYALGRFLLGALPGAATVWVVAILGKRVVSVRAGLWAAAMMSVCFLPVRDSHYIYTDIPLSLALVIALIAILRIHERGVRKDYLWAGAMVGLCTAIKYNAALVGGAYFLAHWLRQTSLREKIVSGQFWAGVGASLAVFIVTNPFAVLDFSFFIQSFAAQGQAQGFVGWTHHLSYSLVGGMGGYALAAALIGAGMTLVQKNTKACILLGFLIPFYLGITFLGQEHDRYALPLIPFLSVFLGIFIEGVLPYFSAPATLNQSWKPSRRLVFIGCIVFFLLPMFIKSAYSDWLFLQPDSRTLAKRWIEANVAPGTKIALDHTFYVPKLLPSREQLQEKLERARGGDHGPSAQKRKKLERLLALVKPEEKRYPLYFLSDEHDRPSHFSMAEPRSPFDFQRLQQEGVKVVIMHHIFARTPHFAFRAQVDSHSRDLYFFSPYRAEWQDFSQEPCVRTGGAFLWPEMLDRKSNGEYVLVYLLK